MSWFETTGFASLAKSALNTAQKTIDRALDIREDGQPKTSTVPLENVKGDESFFSSFGLGEIKSSTPSTQETTEDPTITKSPSKSGEGSQLSHSGLWGDWGASFYNISQSQPSTSEVQMSPSKEDTLPETSQPSASSVLPLSVEIEGSTVFQQPQRKQLFPEDETVTESINVSQDADTTEEENNKCKVVRNSAPLSLQSKKELPECSSSVNDLLQTKVEEKPEILEESSHEMSVSALLAELTPGTILIHVPALNVVTPLEELQNSEKEISVTSVPQMEVSNDTSTSSNESAETLCEDDDEDETEEELTVMEKKPRDSRELQLDLPSTLVPLSDPPSTDYYLIENPSAHDIANIQGSYSEPSISCSTSMEIILETEVMCEESDELASPHPTSDSEVNPKQDINSQVSSPDSIVPICEEPSSNLSSPHFPDIYIIPASTSYISVPLDLISDQNMCDSDITILSPSVGESTDSESCDNKQESEPAEPKEVQDCETSSSGSKASHTSSSGSFVNCSLEDADQCYMQREHSISSNNNSERSSDPMGKETETSGHTSGDEFETTTSSDIEIISPPNGDNGERISTSPLKHILVPRLHRMRALAESSASVDTTKENFAMPVVLESDEQKVHFYDSSMESRNENESPESETLVKRIIALQEVLAVREKKVLDLSKENADMLEANSRMKSRVERLEETHSKESEDVSNLTREFSQRLSQLECRLHETQEERDLLKNDFEKLKAESSNSVSAEAMSALVKEKDQQISELMQEGEKLSKQQLQLSTIIKKLRAKEKETEVALKAQKEKVEEQTKELERLRKSMAAKDEQEKKHIDAIRQLTTTVHKQEEEKATLRSELEDGNDKLRSMKNNMDRAYKEMTDAQKKLAEKESEIQEAVLSAEMASKDSLRYELRQAQEQTEKEREALLGQASQLRVTLSRMEQQAHIREESLRADIAVLQQRLQEADIRNDDLTQNISSATRPLLRQIENLQCMHSSQTVSWEKLEKTLTLSLQESQKQTAVAKEEATHAIERLSALSAQMAATESRCRTIGQEKVQLASQMELLRVKAALLEESKQRDTSAVEALKQNFAEEMTLIKKEKDNALREVFTLKEELEKKRNELTEQKLEGSPGPSSPSGRSSPTLSMTLSHHTSASENARWGQEQGSESGFEIGGRPSLHDAWWGGSASTMIENLQSQVKLRQGEAQQLQSEINRLDRLRESVANELGAMGRINEDLQSQIDELQDVKQSFQEMDQKYNTLLQMYGEKVEESEELKLDLADVKAMYRAQIDELLQKS